MSDVELFGQALNKVQFTHVNRRNFEQGKTKESKFLICFPVLKQFSAEHYAQSVWEEVKTAQCTNHFVGERKLYVSFCHVFCKHKYFRPINKVADF